MVGLRCEVFVDVGLTRQWRCRGGELAGALFGDTGGHRALGERASFGVIDVEAHA
jgi:hypothetical protein